MKTYTDAYYALVSRHVITEQRNSELECREKERRSTEKSLIGLIDISFKEARYMVSVLDEVERDDSKWDWHFKHLKGYLYGWIPKRYLYELTGFKFRFSK